MIPLLSGSFQVSNRIRRNNSVKHCGKNSSTHFSVGLWRTLHETSTLYSCCRPCSGPYGRRAKAERERQSQNKGRGGHQKRDNERIQAQIHADATALDRIYAADFIGVGPSGTVRTKPQVILDFTSGDLKFQSITTDDVQVRVYGNTAVETGRSIMNGQTKAELFPVTLALPGCG